MSDTAAFGIVERSHAEDAGSTAPAGLAAFVRDRLEPPVDEMSGLAGSAARDGVDDRGTYRRDLDRIVVASDQLSDLTRRAAAGGDPDATLSVRRLRHDLRTPITAILGYSELVSEEASDDGRADLVDELATIVELANRLLSILDELLPSSAEKAVPVLDGAETETAKKILSPASSPHRPVVDAVRGRILVVDDADAMRDLASRRLEAHGHEVRSCGSGEEALEILTAGGVDLVMLDLLMPGIDGLEVLRRMRSRPETSDVPVVVMSALDDVEAAVRCIEAGADDYLSKPLDDTLLRARIGSSLDRKFLRDRERENLHLLKTEQERSETLLRNILPGSVVDRLRAGETVVADHFEEATVLFSDLVGFTRLASRLPTRETLDLLEDVFSRFDALAEAEGLEKIKTIGDAYLVVGGVPDVLPDHAARVLRMAARMADEVRATRHGASLALRVGVATGPVAAGIVGAKKLFYDVFGDTVNTASRLEASCAPGRVHVSAATVAAAGPGFAFEDGRLVDLAGKGVAETFLLARTDVVPGPQSV